MGDSSAAALMALLQAARRLEGGSRVLVTGPGCGEAAQWAVAQGARVTAWVDSVAEATTLTALRLPTLAVRLQSDYAGLELGTYDVALVLLDRGRLLQEEVLRVAAALLRPGGRLACVGATQEGVRGAVEFARALYGQAGVVARKGGYHAAVAVRPPGEFPLPEPGYVEREVVVDGLPTRLIGRPGVFAWEGVDEGAAALIAGLRVAPGERLLDLGCGTGLVGLATRRRGAVVTAVDVSARAVESTRRTLAANGCPETPVLLSDGVAAVAGQRFEVVATNPPFHRGHGVAFETARRFIAGAAQVLAPEGRLYLVANTFLRYEPWLRQHFSAVSVAWEDRRFRVWEAR